MDDEPETAALAAPVAHEAPAAPLPPVVNDDEQSLVSYVHALLRWAGVNLPHDTHP